MGDPKTSATRGAWPTDLPKRGPSQTILAWPLRRRPLLDDAGYIPPPRGVRAKTSARARPRTGRIRSIGVDRSHRLQTEPPHLRFTREPSRVSSRVMKSFSEASNRSPRLAAPLTFDRAAAASE